MSVRVLGADGAVRDDPADLVLVYRNGGGYKYCGGDRRYTVDARDRNIKKADLHCLSIRPPSAVVYGDVFELTFDTDEVALVSVAALSNRTVVCLSDPSNDWGSFEAAWEERKSALEAIMALHTTNNRPPQSLLANHAKDLGIGDLYAAFEAEGYEAATSTWTNNGGSGADRGGDDVRGGPVVVKDTLNGRAVLKGGTNDGIRLGPLPEEYTLFHVARYAPDADAQKAQKKRIFVADSADWVSGFCDGMVGVASRGDVWLTDESSAGEDWRVSTDMAGMFRSNGVDRTIAANHSAAVPKDDVGAIGINSSQYEKTAAEKELRDVNYSDWQVAEVLVYSRELNKEEYEAVEHYLESKYQIGKHKRLRDAYTNYVTQCSHVWAYVHAFNPGSIVDAGVLATVSEIKLMKDNEVSRFGTISGLDSDDLTNISVTGNNTRAALYHEGCAARRRRHSLFISRYLLLRRMHTKGGRARADRRPRRVPRDKRREHRPPRARARGRHRRPRGGGGDARPERGRPAVPAAVAAEYRRGHP